MGRLEGRAFEESMVAELMGKTRSFGGIRMLDDGGRGQLVTPAQDVRVEAVAVRMAVIAGEISSALKAHGWSIVRADQTCELAGGLSSGEKHSIDLVLSKEGATVFVESKWSPTAVAKARNAGAQVLDNWLRAAAKGCVFLYPSGHRRAQSAVAAAVLAVSPYGWSFQVDGDPFGSISGRFSAPCTSQWKYSRGRSGTSGSAKRSRNPVAKSGEVTYRLNEGRTNHNACVRASMAKRRAL